MDFKGWKVDFRNMILIMMLNFGVIIFCDEKLVGFGVIDKVNDYNVVVVMI